MCKINQMTKGHCMKKPKKYYMCYKTSKLFIDFQQKDIYKLIRTYN